MGYHYTANLEVDGESEWFQSDSKEEVDAYWWDLNHSNKNVCLVSEHVNTDDVFHFVNLTNHEMTAEQVQDAKEQFGITGFVKIPFPNVPADATEEQVANIVSEVMKTLKDEKRGTDRLYVMVQGEFGVTVSLVRRLSEIPGIIPVYATTERNAVEEKLPDGTIKKYSVFKHVRFRKYNEISGGGISQKVESLFKWLEENGEFDPGDGRLAGNTVLPVDYVAQKIKEVFRGW